MMCMSRLTSWIFECFVLSRASEINTVIFNTAGCISVLLTINAALKIRMVPGLGYSY